MVDVNGAIVDKSIFKSYQFFSNLSVFRMQMKRLSGKEHTLQFLTLPGLIHTESTSSYANTNNVSVIGSVAELV